MAALHSRRLSVARRALVLLLAVLTLLSLAELALHVVKPFPRDAPWYPGERVVAAELKESTVVDPALGWRFAAHAVVDDPSPDFRVTYDCNEEGFRVAAERDGDLPVVFVGDSFTFGTGVEEGEVFVDRLAEAHAELRVFNYGMAGYGVDQMWRTLVERGLAKKPRLVVATFVVDDLNRSLTAFRFRNGWCAKPTYALVGGELVPRTRENSPNAVTRFVQRELYLAELVRRVENKLGLQHGFGARFELNLALFAAMRASCEEAGAELVVVHLPQRNAWAPLPAFARAFAERGIAFLDVGALPKPDVNALYFAHDPHINAAGHAYLAEQLSTFLVARRLLPAPPR